jgi:hypothetical protein
MTLAIYKQLERDGTKLHVERRESSKTNNVDWRLVGAQNAVQTEHGGIRQRDKVKKKNKQLAGPNLAYVA